MSRFNLSRRARQDLKDIYCFIARDRPMAARRFRETLENTFGMLARNPRTGEARPDLRQGEKITFTIYGIVA